MPGALREVQDSLGVDTGDGRGTIALEELLQFLGQRCSKECIAKEATYVKLFRLLLKMSLLRR